MDAADSRALNVARMLIAERTGASATRWITRDLRTCEGLHLTSLDGLSIAIARHDLAMMNLLFPLSNEDKVRDALRLAAKLDHLDLVNALAEKMCRRLFVMRC